MKQILFLVVCIFAASITIASAVQAVGNGTLALPLTVINGGTGTASPNPTVTATACGAAASISGSFPSQQVNIPAPCATTYPQIVAGGGNFAITAFAVPTSSAVPIATPSPTVTLGTSHGPVGAWDVVVQFGVIQSSTDMTFLCITGTTAGTNQVYTSGSAAAVTSQPKTCTGSSTNMANVLAGIATTGGFAEARYEAQYSNAAAPVFGCYGLGGSSGGSENILGYCIIKATPI